MMAELRRVYGASRTHKVLSVSFQVFLCILSGFLFLYPSTIENLGMKFQQHFFFNFNRVAEFFVLN